MRTGPSTERDNFNVLVREYYLFLKFIFRFFFGGGGWRGRDCLLFFVVVVVCLLLLSPV